MKEFAFFILMIGLFSISLSIDNIVKSIDKMKEELQKFREDFVIQMEIKNQIELQKVDIKL